MRTLLLVTVWAHAVFALPLPSQQEAPSEPTASLGVLSWNIWHGGREDGETVGPQRVVDVIRASKADLVAMQETYGSGEKIAKALGFNFQPRGTNVSILSRYPIVEDISVFEEFKCVGALVELPDGSRVALYSIWLPYDAEIWAAGTRETSKPATMLAACGASARDLGAMRVAIEERLAGEKYADVPIILAGDFNSMSHLDYGEVGFDQHDAVIDWPTSHVLADAGFRDSYRECHPRMDRIRDSTWTPRFPEQEQDRIDFIHYRSVSWRAAESRVLREHADGFPSDHAALHTEFRRRAEPAAKVASETLRTVSYNIRHGHGIDGRVDLARTAQVLRELKADVIGLQEVDLRAKRTAGRNQVLELAGILSMHPAFGSFMDFQGGRYGMAVLSRHPIVDVRRIELPTGNEPRIALAVKIRLPDGRTIEVVNVHFDWVSDDAFRYAQALLLAKTLRARATPYVLLGDFNDQPGSRTLALFREIATEAVKPRADRLTFSSTEPEREIDFIFYAPKDAWQVGAVSVIEEPLASDHRPVLAVLRLIGG